MIAGGVTPVNQAQDRTPARRARPKITHVVFDFDGTLSWLRHGWPELMTGLFLQHLARPAVPAPSAAHDLLLEDVLALNGKSSIYQMERCAQRVLDQGGPKLDPQRMLALYQEALLKLVCERKEKIKSGQAGLDEFLVHGARPLLEQLKARGLRQVIVSGTVEPQVKEEAALLNLTDYFGAHIYGSTANLKDSSKQAVLERLMRQEQITGQQVLSFGDGPVEIQLTKGLGGLAVGVASDEDFNGSGRLHPHKASQLRQAGADLLIADYREAGDLIASLIGP